TICINTPHLRRLQASRQTLTQPEICAQCLLRKLQFVVQWPSHAKPKPIECVIACVSLSSTRTKAKSPLRIGRSPIGSCRLEGGDMAQATARINGSVERYFERQHGIDSSLITRLLDEALSRGGEYADLYFEHRLSRDFQFEDQSVKNSSSHIIQGVGIRVV